MEAPHHKYCKCPDCELFAQMQAHFGTNKPEPNTRAGEALAADNFKRTGEWPDPTSEMLETVLFDTIWRTIKTWDVNVPHAYSGYMGATGNHVRAIYDAVAPLLTRPLPQPSELVETPEAFNKKKERCLAYVEQHWKWGNLTRLGIVNQLVRDGFRQTWAIEQADRIAPAANQAVAHITQLEAQIAKLQADGERLAEALEAFQRHYDLNDCDERCGALEVPISDLRRACQALTEWKDRA